ncbi:hypothetical protein RKLH11_1057 [Rhodobacteraceae bacterium KLH11]|nr:hypothetical protein RKLH11_1057 [Rhodobacteraceae bacterium KLH11]
MQELLSFSRDAAYTRDLCCCFGPENGKIAAPKTELSHGV